MLIIIPLFYIFISILIGLLAKGKTIGFWGGFLFSFFLSPLIGFIIAVASASKSSLRQPVINNYYVPPVQQQEQQQEHQQVNHNTNHPEPELKPVSSSESKLQLLEKLAAMRNNGILSEEEFQSEKAKMLRD
jgi:hypothetical protein